MGCSVRQAEPRGKSRRGADGRYIHGMTTPKTILVVDDERTVREAAVEHLRQAGYEVLEAGSGIEALAVLTSHGGAVDLLLTDVSMRGMDGGELAEAVADARPGIRVLFMSGYSAGAPLHDGERDPGVDFIAKPFLGSALLRRVQAALGPA